MTKGIILESSSIASIIATVENDQIKHQMQIFSERNLSNILFTFLNDFKKDFSFIGVGIGPGSYTGVRISLTIAKSLAYALNTPIVCFSSLESFIPESYGKFISIFDAKVGGVYACFGNHTENSIHFSEPKLYSITQITSLIKETPKIISPQIDVLKTKINLSDNIECISGKPNAKMLAKICFNRFSRKNFISINDLKPIYLRDA